MAASQDKVQGILQTVLQQSLPLVHKGIFTSAQLQNAMCQRQKQENNMLKSTFKLSDYLKAIQFEYQLERIRRNRTQILSQSNPLFKKQSKTDFIIVKRIIKLWDRTTHKFKYNSELWKQYLDFCIKIGSKKQFYKALSNGLRFLPFSQDLWLIGVYYEIEVGFNLWKARKILFKAVKMMGKKSHIWVEMFKFEIKFLKTLYERQLAIKGEQRIEFITSQKQEKANQEREDLQIEDKDGQDPYPRIGNQNYDGIKLQQHDDILLMVYEQATSKIENKPIEEFKLQLVEILEESIQQSRIKQIQHTLRRALMRINKGTETKKESLEKIEYKKPSFQINGSIKEKLQYFQQFLSENKQLSYAEFDKITAQFLTKPAELAKLLIFCLEQNEDHCLNYLILNKKFKLWNLPALVIEKVVRVLSKLIDRDNNKVDLLTHLRNIIHNTNANKYRQSLGLLKSVIIINKKQRWFKENNDIYRSLSIIGKSEPQTLERCLAWIQQKDIEQQQ